MCWMGKLKHLLTCNLVPVFMGQEKEYDTMLPMHKSWWTWDEKVSAVFSVGGLRNLCWFLTLTCINIEADAEGSSLTVSSLQHYPPMVAAHTMWDTDQRNLADSSGEVSQAPTARAHFILFIWKFRKSNQILPNIILSLQTQAAFPLYTSVLQKAIWAIKNRGLSLF